jgi:hypothetical protein
MVKNKRNNKKPKVKIIQPKVKVVEKRIVKKKKPTKVGQFLRTAGGVVGGYFGNATLGRNLGAGLSKIVGSGDYYVGSNGGLINTVPQFANVRSAMRIQHREYIGDIQSSVGFQNTSYSINPGMEALFPWLSSLADCFEEYILHGLVIYLQTTSATAVSSTNTALGVWGAVTVYDPTQSDFTTKSQCENYAGCQSGVPSACIMHMVECRRNSNVLNKMYIRTSSVSDSENLKFYDYGKVQIFTQGSQAVSTIGELWVSYDVEFFKPKLPSSANDASADHFSLDFVSTTNPLGSALVPTANTGSNLGVVLAGSSSPSITIPADAPLGLYLFFNIIYLPSGTGWTSPTLNLQYGDITFVEVFNSSTDSGVAAPTDGTNTTRFFWASIGYHASNTLTNISVDDFAIDVVVGNSDFFAILLPSGLASTFLALAQKKKENVTQLELAEIRQFIKNIMAKEERERSISREDTTSVISSTSKKKLK